MHVYKTYCCKVALVVSNTVWPHRQQHTRLPRPWDSPGKNTGVVCHFLLQCGKVKSESEVDQSCLTLCDPMDCSLPGSSIHGILQARTLEWVAISFSSAQKWKGKGKSLSRVPLFATPWAAAHQAPPSMGFSRQEHWSGVPLPLLSYKKEWVSSNEVDKTGAYYTEWSKSGRETQHTYRIRKVVTMILYARQ